MKRLMGDDDDRSGWGVSVVVEVGMESEKTCDKGCDATWKLEKREKLAWVEGGGRRKTKVAQGMVGKIKGGGQRVKGKWEWRRSEDGL